jgi:xanthine dehydrogenase accessory factor
MTSLLTDRFDAALARLRATGQPYAVATVVRTVDATSAKPGAKALILSDGTIAEGWVGGGCARGAVGRAGAACIRSGVPQLLSLRPADLLEDQGLRPGEERDGAQIAASHCPSRGSMDIFVEPVLPRPRLVVLGAGPVAQALADLAGRFDLHRTLAAPGLVGAVAETAADTVADGFEAGLGGVAPAFVVVATQGRGDEAGLRAAVASGAGYLAFVGSRRKFSVLSERLAATGVAPAALARVKAPAGLDIQAITPEEIALSILAEITQSRRSGERDRPATPGADRAAGAVPSGPSGSAADNLAGAGAGAGVTRATGVAAAPGGVAPGGRRSLFARARALVRPLTADQSELVATLRFPCC